MRFDVRQTEQRIPQTHQDLVFCFKYCTVKCEVQSTQLELDE